jgi:hypothetical protein
MRNENKDLRREALITAIVVLSVRACDWRTRELILLYILLIKKKILLYIYGSTVKLTGKEQPFAVDVIF